MILLFMLFSISSVFAFPVHLSEIEIDHPYKGDAEWQCFSVNQIKKLECLEWADDREEHSDLDLVIEADIEVHHYAFNDANSICSEFKQDFLNILRKQRFFCIYGNPVSRDDFVFPLKAKPKVRWVYECLKTNLGQVAWHGGFGSCVED